MSAALVHRARTLGGWWLSPVFVGESSSFLRSASSRCQLRREGHLVLQTSFAWILPFLTCFCFSVKVLCSVPEVFGRQVGLLCPPGREGGGRHSEGPADHLGCPLRQHPFFLSHFVFLKMNILPPKVLRTHREG